MEESLPDPCSTGGGSLDKGSEKEMMLAGGTADRVAENGFRKGVRPDKGDRGPGRRMGAHKEDWGLNDGWEAQRVGLPG